MLVTANASRRFRCALCTACLVAGSLGASPAAAAEGDQPTDAERAAAQVLFDEARDLLQDEATYAKACAKFAESMRLDRAIGTQLNLGLCYEKLGRYASAWINFEEARSRAQKAGMTDRVALAAERAEGLVGRLSKMKLIVTTPAADMVITRDGFTVGEAQWGSEVPVDGGRVVIEATAPGKLKWRTAVKVETENDRVEVVVPTLEDAPVEPEVVGPGTPVGPDNTGLYIGAGVAGGVGLVGVALGSVFGILAGNKNDESAAFCTANECNAQGVTLRDEAFINAHVSTAGFAVGGAGIALGTILLIVGLTSEGDANPDGDAHSWTVTPWLGEQQGASVGWTF